MTTSFENALQGRVDDMITACTRCGACVEACPVAGPAGVAAPAKDVIAGVIDILRTQNGSDAARRWARSCMLSGDCIAACAEGVNPRFLLAMARVTMARSTQDIHERRRAGVVNFRKLSQDVAVLSRMQLTPNMLARLGQEAEHQPGSEAEPPDFVFYTGCNVLKTPHIALLALDVMDALGVTYRVMGGPTHCCGVIQLRSGDTEVSGNVAENTIAKLAQAKNSRVLSWCASCHVQFTEVTLPAHERTQGSRPFEMTPFMLFLGERLDALRPLLRHRVEIRVALHRHHGVRGVVEAALDILTAVPGLELVDLHQPSVGLMSNALATLPDYKQSLYRAELEAARDAGVDALVAVYHPDHRELCAHERDWPFQIVNILDIVGASLGISREDHYKRLKKLQDVDLILSECHDLLGRHRIDEADARRSIQSMLDDQPLPLVRTS
jgi:Fe-S oxidoreductase